MVSLKDQNRKHSTTTTKRKPYTETITVSTEFLSRSKKNRPERFEVERSRVSFLSVMFDSIIQSRVHRCPYVHRLVIRLPWMSVNRWMVGWMDEYTNKSMKETNLFVPVHSFVYRSVIYVADIDIGIFYVFTCLYKRYKLQNSISLPSDNGQAQKVKPEKLCVS